MTKDLVLVARSMIKNLDEKTIRVGFGKYYERYEYLRRYGEKYIEKKDIKELERLWKEIKNIQQERGYKERNIPITIQDLVMEMKEIRKKHTDDLLLKFYRDRGSEFILNEINEYLDSIKIYHKNLDRQNGVGGLMRIYSDKIELFDAYFMLSQYVQIDREYLRLLETLERIVEAIKTISRGRNHL